MGRRDGCWVETDFTFRGWRLVILKNRNLRVTVLPEKGSDIIEFRYKPLDLDVMWESPIGLRPNGWFVPTNGNALAPTKEGAEQGNFMDYYEGGWQEIFPNAGPATKYKGTTIGQHGEVALTPWQWQVLEEGGRRASIKMSVNTYRTPFRVEKILTLEGDKPTLFIEEKVTNLAGETLDFSWGHHPAFGAPFLSGRSLIELPGKPEVEVCPGDGVCRTNLVSGKWKWPLVDGKKGKVDLRKVPAFEDKISNMMFLTNLPKGEYRLTNPEEGLTFRMEWDIKVFSYLWYWQVAGGSFGYPWWGQTYNIALEPFSGPPMLSRAIKEGKALSLQAGKSLSTTLSASFLTT